MKFDRSITACLAASLFVLPLSVAAQPLDLSTLQELDDDRTDIDYQGISIDQLEDMDVIRDGQRIGEVEEVLGDASGQVVALVIEYGGNAVGIGDREVAVPIDQLQLSAQDNTVETTLTDEELDAMPEWDD